MNTKFKQKKINFKIGDKFNISTKYYAEKYNEFLKNVGSMNLFYRQYNDDGVFKNIRSKKFCRQ